MFTAHSTRLFLCLRMQRERMHLLELYFSERSDCSKFANLPGVNDTLNDLVSERHDSSEIRTATNLPGVNDTLDDLVSERHDSSEIRKATNLLNSFTFEFVVTLMFWNELLPNHRCNVTASLKERKLPLSGC